MMNVVFGFLELAGESSVRRGGGESAGYGWAV